MTTQFRGELRWGVKASFREYVENAEGTTSVIGGATIADDGRVVFPLASTEWTDGAPRALRFAGGVVFDAYEGLLALTLREPWLEFGEDGIVLTVMHPAFRGVTDVRLAMCRLGDVNPPVDTRELCIDDASTAILIDASATFNHLYPPGTAFDPVSLWARRA